MQMELEDALWVGRTLPASQVDTQSFQEEHMTCYPMHSNYGSRLDRIYVPKEKTSWVHRVTTKAPSVFSDHKQVTLILKDPKGIRTKKNPKLYACNVDAFLETQPILSHLLLETTWSDKKAEEVPRSWDELKRTISQHLRDLRRIRGATKKAKKRSLLAQTGADHQGHTRSGQATTRNSS